MERHIFQRIIIVGVVIALLVAVLLTTPSFIGQANSFPERSVEVTYRFTVRDIPADAKQITAWVPIPPSNIKQHLESFHVEGNWIYTIFTDAEYGNRFIRFDLSGVIPEDDATLKIAITFRINRKSYRPLDMMRDIESPSPATLARFLAPDRLVPIDGKLAEEARRIAREAEGPLAQGKSIYDHIIQSVVYDKSGVGWGRGDASYACDVRKGNCTDFHSLFIGEVRALGIPARFIMGLPLSEGKSEGTIPGYHCWAEFYMEGKGWIPVDASEASKFPEKKELFFGSLDMNRVEFTTGRDIQLPGTASGPLNYIIYPYMEIDGQPHENIETHLSFREVRRP